SGEPGGFELFVNDDCAVGFVNRRGKQRGSKEVKILMLIDPGLSHQRHGLGKRLDHAGNQKIAADLDQVRVVGLRSKAEGFLAEGVEKRHAGGDRVVRAASYDDQLGRRGRLGSSKDRSGNIALTAL